MLTIQTVENINKGSRITFFNGVYSVILGILYLIFTIPVIKMNFRKINLVWQVFAKYNPELNRMFLQMMIIKGIFIIAIGIMIIYLSNYILKKKDKTAWIVLFIIGLLFWPVLFIVEFFNKNPYTIIVSFIGWITFIIGMVLPLKYYLQKEYTEY